MLNRPEKFHCNLADTIYNGSFDKYGKNNNTLCN